jgi:hypothetical protein
MSYVSDRVASRHGRDRDLLPAGPRVGPYEQPYDVRRGYQQPLRRGADAPAVDVLLFRARDDYEEGRED